MKKYPIIAFLFLPFFLQAQCLTLVWSDEFDYTGTPNPSKWTYDLGDGCSIGICGWGNGEQQYYTNESKNVRVENGNLIIEARKENRSGKAYTSARILSKERGDWTYGRVEVRAKLPEGKGTWPAIWMLPTDSEYGGWPNSGEIDIMEHVGRQPNRVFGTVHTGAYNHGIGTQKENHIDMNDVFDTYHVYAVEWYEDRIKWFVDDEHYGTFRNENKTSAEWPFDKRFHLIMNIAMGGSFGGSEIDNSVLPQQMAIDYVRVYSLDGAFKIEGPSSVKASEKDLNYKATPIEDATYNWTVSSGATITSGQGTNTIKVNWGINSGKVDVEVKGDKVNCENTEASLDVNISGIIEGDVFRVEDLFEDDLRNWSTEIADNTKNSYELKKTNDGVEINYNITDLSSLARLSYTLPTLYDLTDYPFFSMGIKGDQAYQILLFLIDKDGNKSSAFSVNNTNPNGSVQNYAYDFSSSWSKVDAQAIRFISLEANRGQSTFEIQSLHFSKEDDITSLEFIQQQDVQIYPNPNQGSFFVILPQSYTPYLMKFYDLQGKELALDIEMQEIGVYRLVPAVTPPKGMYSLSIETDRGISFHKVIIE